jgi:hypothetical protein
VYHSSHNKHKPWKEYLVVVVELAAGVLVAILSDLLLKINYLKGGRRKIIFSF